MEPRRDKRQMWVRVRMTLVALVINGMFCAVVARVYYLQTVERDHLGEKAVDQTHKQIKLKAKRGSILDRNGVELAVSVESPSIAVRPRLVADDEKPELARKLAEILDMDIDSVRRKLDAKPRFVWIKRQAAPDAGERVKALDHKGLEVHLESKRFYPLKERAGQLVGFTNIDGVGLEGMERAFEKEIAGAEYHLEGVRDARGRTMLTQDTPEFNRLEGHSVVLTIDERIQRVAEEAVAEMVDVHGAKGGYVVALDPKTGEVLALANTPSFDPNHYRSASAEDWRLRAVTDTFEPGSVFKPFVLAGALQEGTIGLNTMVDCELGKIRIGKYTIGDSHPVGVVTAAEVVQQSSNIGAYKIAQTMGRERFYQYIRAFGFGRTTGVGLRGEQPGVVWPPDRWAEVSFANIAFGQGVTATPLQVANATAVIANGGMLLEPHIVKRVVDKDGNTVRETSPTLIRRVLTPEVARQAAWAMALVPRKGGTGMKAAMEHYTVAGKTGTAQKVNPETRRYDNLWLGSFVGFAPAEDPAVVVAVMIDEPKGRGFGGTVAAPAFKRIAAEALSVRGVVPIPPEERFQFDEEKFPAAKFASDKKVASPTPAEPVEEPVAELAAIEIDESDTTARVPDLRGLTLREAVGRVRELGGLPEVEGWGRVVSQDPAPGTPLAETKRIAIALSPATRQSLMAEEPSLGGTE